jgi:hypothetical protein
MAEAGTHGSEDTRVPGVDMTRPSIARIYDYLLGGKENYAVDRALADRFIKDLPGSQAIAFDNRGVLTRAVSVIADETPVRQFIDLGSGLPTEDNVHQVAQRHAPECKVVYVDEILALFGDGLTVLPPGLVPAAELRPTQPPHELTAWERLIGAALAVKS